MNKVNDGFISYYYFFTVIFGIWFCCLLNHFLPLEFLHEIVLNTQYAIIISFLSFPLLKRNILGEDSGEYFFLAFLSLWSFQYVGFSKISLSFSPPFIFPNWYVLIWHWYKKCSLFFQPTSPHRGWFVPPFGGNPWWVYLAAAIPALLVTILIFMDQQITAVIVNRKEHKLKVSVYSTGYSCLLLYL